MSVEISADSTRHEFRGAKVFPSRTAMLTELCQDKTVLHVGCVDAGFYEKHVSEERFLHDALCAVAKRAIGVDIDADGVSRMAADGHKDVYALDVTTVEGRTRVQALIGATQRIEIVVCGEVIEHVSSPLHLMIGLIELANSNQAEIVLTTPNPFYGARFLNALRGREIVHPDHNAYISAANLKGLVEKAGYRGPVTLAFYLNLPRSRFLAGLKKMLGHAFPTLSDGIVLRLRP